SFESGLILLLSFKLMISFLLGIILTLALILSDFSMIASSWVLIMFQVIEACSLLCAEDVINLSFFGLVPYKKSYKPKPLIKIDLPFFLAIETYAFLNLRELSSTLFHAMIDPTINRWKSSNSISSPVLGFGNISRNLITLLDSLTSK